jgi:TctA family transporter
MPTVRGTAIGVPLGILPGGGPLIASVCSYAVEKKIARDPSRFGKGAIEGVAAPEAAANSAAFTSFIPMLAIGIPASTAMALMLGGLLIQGIQPGPRLMTRHPDIFWGLVASMWIGNLMLLVLNLPLGRMDPTAAAPYCAFYPLILAFCCIGICVFAAGVRRADRRRLRVRVRVMAKFDFSALCCAGVVPSVRCSNLRRALRSPRGDRRCSSRGRSARIVILTPSDGLAPPLALRRRRRPGRGKPDDGAARRDLHGISDDRLRRRRHFARRARATSTAGVWSAGRRSVRRAVRDIKPHAGRRAHGVACRAKTCSARCWCSPPRLATPPTRRTGSCGA